MTIFDLLFLCVVLGSVVTLLSIAAAAMSGKRHRALVLLRAYAIFMVLYLATAVAVRFSLPVRVLALGEPQCSDDWCITVVGAHTAGPEYDVDLRLTSRARRVEQREKGLVVYLVDERGTRYTAIPDPSAIPLDVLLQAGESVMTTRKFDAPDKSGRLEFVLTREGFQVGWLIIGRNPFERTVVRID